MFDRTSAPGTHRPVTRQALDYARSKGNARYEWTDNCNCACAQFFQDTFGVIGRDWLVDNSRVERLEGVDLNAVAHGYDISRVLTAAESNEARKGWTFDQFAKRLELALEDELVLA